MKPQLGSYAVHQLASALASGTEPAGRVEQEAAKLLREHFHVVVESRPSVLNRAELCGLVPVLSEQHPEEVPAGWHNNDIHTEIARCLNTGDEPILPQAKAAIDWLHDNYDLRKCEVLVEVHIVLVDPDTMEVVTEGTADLVLRFSDGSVVIIDWKAGNPEHVREVDDNLQMLSYGLGASIGNPFQCVIVFLDGPERQERLHSDGLKATAQYGTNWQPHQFPGLLARVKAAAKRTPVPSVGDWCPDCYVRHYCPAYSARLTTAIDPVSKGGSITKLDDESASALADMVAMVDGDKGWLAAAKLALKEHVRAGGTVLRNGKRMAIVPCKGRATADVKALEAAGLHQYIKQGADHETTKWVKP